VARASLKDVATSVLSRLRDAIASGVLRAPVDCGALVGLGFRDQLDAI
jgi:hypothetical protein